ncbi:hypothetical protein D3C80_1455120 [compost metagenome]
MCASWMNASINSAPVIMKVIVSGESSNNANITVINHRIIRLLLLSFLNNEFENIAADAPATPVRENIPMLNWS